LANRDINQGSNVGNRGNQRENMGGGQMGGQRQGWDQFRGKLREKWGNLREEDLNRVGKNRNELVGHISQQGGVNKQDVERDIDRISRETGYRFE
jgi:uncharacterized protein YjbJ (UPF0337 family)